MTSETSRVNDALTTSDYWFSYVRCTCTHKHLNMSTWEDRCISKVIHQSSMVMTGPPAMILIFSPSNDRSYHKADVPQPVDCHPILNKIWNLKNNILSIICTQSWILKFYISRKCCATVCFQKCVMKIFINEEWSNDFRSL